MSLYACIVALEREVGSSAEFKELHDFALSLWEKELREQYKVQSGSTGSSEEGGKKDQTQDGKKNQTQDGKKDHTPDVEIEGDVPADDKEDTVSFHYIVQYDY